MKVRTFFLRDKNLIRNFITFIAIYFIQSVSISPEEVFPKIYDSEQWTSIGFEEIAEKFKGVDVLVIGEEHDDKQGHIEKLKLIKYLSEKQNISISMEMFERDQQIILNEFLEDFLDEKLFESNLKLWNNYEDYKPILLFSKEKKISMIAANAPRRYVRILSKKGLEAIYNLPDSSKVYFAPLFTVEFYRNEVYEKKIKDSISAHVKEGKTMENMMLSQNLWDATMTDSILKEVEKKKAKVVHINGRFHSDENLGVTHRLKEFGIKVLTISMFSKNSEELLEKKTLGKYADIIYVTGEKKTK